MFRLNWSRAVLLGGLLAVFAAPTRAADQPPNFVVIVTDDQGWGDVSCHGNPVIETPHIDALRAGGCELTRFYVSPVCSPTRACLMTGRYNYRTRVIDTWRGRSMMEPDEQTVAELLGDAGYATGIFGKWHLGDCRPMRPQDQGFDESVVCRGGGLAQPSEPPENDRRYTNPILWRNGQQFQAIGYCTDVFFGAAEEFIEQSVARGQPFLTFVTPNAPHGPFHDVPTALYEKYKARSDALAELVPGGPQQVDTVARVFAMVENIDENVGRLQATLARLGIADETLVIFMSDNGPQTRRYVGNRRGVKCEVLEGGVASPLFAQWPGRIEPGSTSDRVAAHIDVLPTLLEAAGVKPPAGLTLDGRSLLPLLAGDAGDLDWQDRQLYLQSHRGSHVVPGHNFAVIGQRWKLLRNSGFNSPYPLAESSYELYDLQADPREQQDRIADRPEIVSRMLADYHRWLADVSATRPNNYAPPRIELAPDETAATTLTQQDWQATGPGWGDQGEWLLHAPKQYPADVTVLLPRPAQGTALLSLGGTIVSQVLEYPVDRVEFPGVRVPFGDFSVHFEVVEGGESAPPRQIFIVPRAE